MNNTLEAIHIRLVNTEEWMSYLEERVVEMTQSEQQNEKIKFFDDDSRDFWDNVKPPNIHIIRIPEKEMREKGTERIFEEIMSD